MTLFLRRMSYVWAVSAPRWRYDMRKGVFLPLWPVCHHASTALLEDALSHDFFVSHAAKFRLRLLGLIYWERDGNVIVERQERE